MAICRLNLMLDSDEYDEEQSAIHADHRRQIDARRTTND